MSSSHVQLVHLCTLTPQICSWLNINKHVISRVSADVWLMMTGSCASHAEGYTRVRSGGGWRASPDRAGSRRRRPRSGAVQRAAHRTGSPAVPCPPSSGAAAADVCSAAAHSVRQWTTAASETAAPSRLHANTALQHQQSRATEPVRRALFHSSQKPSGY